MLQIRCQVQRALIGRLNTRQVSDRVNTSRDGVIAIKSIESIDQSLSENPARAGTVQQYDHHSTLMRRSKLSSYTRSKYKDRERSTYNVEQNQQTPVSHTPLPAPKLSCMLSRICQGLKALDSRAVQTRVHAVIL